VIPDLKGSRQRTHGRRGPRRPGACGCRHPRLGRCRMAGRGLL